MKTVGIIGGIAPESTIEYYRFIIARYREQLQNESCPAIIINSIDLNKMLGLVAASRFEELTGYLLNEIEKLAKAGADFGALASNTPHIVFDQLRKQSSIPLLSIVEATCQAAKALGLTKLGLFGTRFTMNGRFYPEVLLKEGIHITKPAPEEQNEIHEKYMRELIHGIFNPETRKAFLRIVETMVTRDHIDGLILGGTELPILLRNAPGTGIPFLDTTKIHVQHIVSELLS